MKMFMSVLCMCVVMLVLTLCPISAGNLTGSGVPLKYISSCEIDFNADGQPDLAFLVETLLGRELIVLIRTDKGYNSFTVSKGRPNMYLTCHFGNTVRQSTALGDAKVYKTPGTYLKLHQPEGASVVYFWDGSGFKEVWTTD